MEMSSLKQEIQAVFIELHQNIVNYFRKFMMKKIAIELNFYTS
jgi:hypothetical protein